MKRALGILMSLGISAGVALAEPAAKQEVAIFATGCFWCTEADFDKVPGVIRTTSGFIGGTVPNPSYQQVTTGTTGHTEAVEVVFDPSKVTYRQLLDVFWRTHDPLAKDRQFCDRGNMYRPGVFVHSDEQRALAEETRKKVQARFAPRVVHTEVTRAGTFYKAEDYHQDFYEKNPVRDRVYRFNCGREQRLEELWGKDDKAS